MKTPEGRSSVSILDLQGYLEKRLSHVQGSLIPTPFTALNRQMDGGLRGLVCLGAAPGYGKSAMAQQIAIYSALKGIPVIYVDLEHGMEFLLLRLYSSCLGLTIETIKERIRSKILGLPPMLKLFTVLTGRVTPFDIQQSIRDLAGDEALCFVVIDSIQKLPQLPGTNPRESANAWIRELEYIKNTYPVVMLVVSELSRGEGARNYTAPHLGSLKESGDLEYTFEQVLMLSPVAGEEKIYRLNLVKNRYGQSGKIQGVVYNQDNFKCWRWEEEEI